MFGSEVELSGIQRSSKDGSGDPVLYQEEASYQCSLEEGIGVHPLLQLAMISAGYESS